MVAKPATIGSLSVALATLCLPVSGMADPIQLVNPYESHQHRVKTVMPTAEQVIQCGAFKHRSGAERRLKQLQLIDVVELAVVTENGLFLVLASAPTAKLKDSLQLVKAKVPDAFMRRSAGNTSKQLTRLVGY